MTSDQAARQNDERNVVVVVVTGCLCALMGTKLWLIGAYGSSTPFWDQWAEATLFRSYLTGTLGFSELFAFHNEHRLVMTRLAALGIFVVAERWDPVLECIVSAFLHTAAIGLLVVLLSRPLDFAGRILLPVFAALIVAIPLNWQNVLFGFHNQYYFLLLLSFASLWLLSRNAAWTPRWLAGTIVGGLGYFTIATGALILAAAAALAIFQFVVRRRSGLSEACGVLLHVALFVAMLVDIPSLPHHSGLAPTSILGWGESLAIVATWPLGSPSFPTVFAVFTAAILHAPSMLLALRLLRERPELRDDRWFYMAIAAWTALHVVAMVHGRGTTALQSRYFDLLLIGILVNAACLFYLTRRRPHRRSVYLAAAWVVVVLLGCGHKLIRNVPNEIAFRRTTMDLQFQNLSRFLATGDLSALKDKPQFHIPFPSAEILSEMVSDPVVRSILPSELMGQRQLRNATTKILENGSLLLPLGLGLVFAAAFLVGMHPNFAASRGHGPERHGLDAQ